MKLKEGCEAKCRGCAHRDISWQESLSQKENWIRTRLNQWSDFISSVKSVNEDKSWHYRDKVLLSTSYLDSAWSLGMIIKSSKEFIAINNCPVHSERVINTFKLLRTVLPPHDVFPLRYWVQSGRQLCLVLKTKYLPDVSWLTQALKVELQELGVEGVWLHLNPSTGKKVFAKKQWLLIFGNPRSTDSDGAVYGPAAFNQLISELYNDSLAQASKFFDIQHGDIVIDLYCGTGKSLMKWSGQTNKIAGVEANGDAAECAKYNVPKALILRGMCQQRIIQLNEWLKQKDLKNHQKLLYVNPPRTGLECGVADWVVKDFQPDKLAYLSCSVGSLYRDLQTFCEAGYRVNKIIPYDFFPHTIHVETLVLLGK